LSISLTHLSSFDLIQTIISLLCRDIGLGSNLQPSSCCSDCRLDLSFSSFQLPVEQGGLEGSALFIDTEGTFSPERVYNIASAMGLETKEVLNKIIIARAYTSDYQSFLIDNLLKICSEENVKLVVVDSMISHFRGEYVGRENLAERQQKLNQCLHKLLRLAEVFPVPLDPVTRIRSLRTPGRSMINLKKLTRFDICSSRCGRREGT